MDKPRKESDREEGRIIEKSDKPIGEILMDRGIIGKKELDEAMEEHQLTGKLLGRVLVEKGFCTEEELLKAIGGQRGIEVVHLSELEIPGEVVDKVIPTMARTYEIMPVRFENNILTIAVADLMNVDTVDDLRFMIGCEVKGVMATSEEINKAIDKYYGSEQGSMKDLLSQMENELASADLGGITDDQAQMDANKLKDLAGAAPVVKLLNLVLVQAVKDKASDIHFEPFEDEFKIRYRIDGALYEMVPPPKSLALALTSRIKVMAELDIAERRLPQDGRIMLAIGSKTIDLRVSTLPTAFGESVVLRVLDKSIVSLSLDQIGFAQETLDRVRALIEKPNGILLATGPTGCGKTTTLYSCLREINKVDYKIITTEDPVEYDIPGIIQVQIKPKIELTFASCLRSMLRQDPDIMMVGEIRDVETAQMAIQASLTGHLVFSTLHTNDAPGAVTRLTDMEIEPFLITSTLEGVFAQRLVRTICISCKEEYEPDEVALSTLGLTPDDVKGKRFFYGTGCDKCNNTGYKGRMAICELLIMNDAIRELVLERAPTADIRKCAQQHGMKTLRGDGVSKIFDGLTTIEEVVRETQHYA